MKQSNNVELLLCYFLDPAILLILLFGSNDTKIITVAKLLLCFCLDAAIFTDTPIWFK